MNHRPFICSRLFYNFRLFTNPQELLELFIQRFHLPPTDTEDWAKQVQTPVRLRVCKMLKTWLESYFMLDQDAVIHTRLLCFTQTDLMEALPIHAESLVQQIHKTVSRHLSSKPPLMLLLVHSQGKHSEGTDRT